MAPKAQPRRKQPVRSGQATTHQSQSQGILNNPSTKEPLVDDTIMSHESQMEIEPTSVLESQPLNTQPEAASKSAEAAASLPPRRPVKRLASVLPRSSSNMSPNPEGDSRPATLKFKPKSFIRRSKEEREAVEKTEAERQAARLAAEKGASTSDRGGVYGRGRGRGGGFGDMSRWKDERFNLSRGASGHLGGSTLAERSASRQGRGGRGGGAGSGGGSRYESSVPTEQPETTPTQAVTRVKKEPTFKSEKDKDGDTVITSSTSKSKSKRAKIKKEDQAPTYVSSEGELDSDGAERVDIERINLITDGEDSDSDLHAQSEVSKGKQRQRAPQIRHDPLRPVRIQREEHVERAVGVNTDASSLTSAELRRKAKERNEAGGSLFLPEADENETSQAPKVKVRRKPKDVEFVRDERRWKGVYQEEDDKDAIVKIKDEPKDDDDAMVVDLPLAKKDTGAEAMEVDDEEAIPLREAVQEPLPNIDETSKVNREIEKSSQTVQGEDLEQSDEERAKAGVSFKTQLRQTYHVRVGAYNDLLAEIKEINSLLDDFEAKPPTSAPTPSTKAADDDEPIDTDHPADIFATADHPSFVFQLPPLVPSLRDITKKPAPPAEEKKPKPAPSKPPTSTNPFAGTPIKPDPDIKADPDAPAPTPQSSIPHTYIAGAPFSPPSGCAGTLSIHRGGKLSAEWGGLGMEVSKGGNGVVAMPQELVMTKFETGVEKREDDDDEMGIGGGVRREEVVRAGEKGWGMGLVREGWMCVPELGGLMG